MRGLYTLLMGKIYVIYFQQLNITKLSYLRSHNLLLQPSKIIKSGQKIFFLPLPTLTPEQQNQCPPPRDDRPEERCRQPGCPDRT